MVKIEKIGILSDAHGCLGCFNKALTFMEKFGASKIIFLGDAVGYSSSLDILTELDKRRHQIKCVLGNHESLILKKEISTDKEKFYKHKIILSKISDRQLKQIRSWPEKIEIKIFEKKILFVHGSPIDPTFGYIYPDSDLDKFNYDYDFVFMGHTHRPFIRKNQKTVFVNVGSCSLPRDGIEFGSFAILNICNNEVTVYKFKINTEIRKMVIDGYLDRGLLDLLNREKKPVSGFTYLD